VLSVLGFGCSRTREGLRVRTTKLEPNQSQLFFYFFLFCHFFFIKIKGVYWIKILIDFKRLFNYEKVLWYSIKTLCNLKKFVVFNQDFLPF